MGLRVLTVGPIFVGVVAAVAVMMDGTRGPWNVDAVCRSLRDLRICATMHVPRQRIIWRVREGVESICQVSGS